MMTVNSLISSWIGDLLACMGGCFGCCAKPTPVIAVDQPTKGLRIQGRIVRKPSSLDDFWSTSTNDLENTAVQSQRSLSSISASNPTLSQCSSAGGIANPSNFVNQGLIVWNQTRLQWIGSSRPGSHDQQSREPKLSWNATYESLLGTRNPFPRPIPLSEMIDFLVEVWEQEGLYDRKLISKKERRISFLLAQLTIFVILNTWEKLYIAKGEMKKHMIKIQFYFICIISQSTVDPVLFSVFYSPSLFTVFFPS